MNDTRLSGNAAGLEAWELRPFRSLPILTVCLALLAAGSFAGPAAAGPGEPVELVQATRELPPETVLDVGIEVLDPGLPEPEDAAEDEGVFPAVRKAESRWLAIQLMRTLQSTGYWGAVRVVPSSAGIVDLAVSGEILESNGARLVVRLTAVDATGRTWLEDKYKAKADERALRDDEDSPLPAADPFQDLYTRFANDLLGKRGKLDDDELREVRRVARMRFAAVLAPEALGDSLERRRNGRWTLAGMPAEGDPMMERIEAIRLRDELFVDTVTGHYSTLYDEMAEPYTEWRRFSYEEEMARREIVRQARTRKIMGVLAVFAGLFADADSRAEAAARDAAVIGGAAAIRSGFAKGKEAKIHVEALRELAASFDAEVEPMLVEIEGRTLRLEGSVDAQYAQWQQILQRMFQHETGILPDPNEPPESPPGEAR